MIKLPMIIMVLSSRIRPALYQRLHILMKIMIWIPELGQQPVWTMAVMQLKWVSDLIHTACKIILSYFF